MADRLSVRVTGTQADIDYVIRRLEPFSTRPIKVTQLADGDVSLVDEPRFGQYELLTVLVDVVVGIGGAAAYDLLKREISRVRGKQARIDDDEPRDDKPHGGKQDSDSP